jgi:pSer/pThr/pTyr-binding forkhead associated (FHA) protein
MLRKLSNPLKLSLLITIIIIPLAVFAQTSGQPKIHLHETPPPLQVTTAGGALGLSLQPSFSLLDGENQVLMAFEIVDANIDIEGESYTAVVQELEVPWTIIYLVDTSITLGGFSTSPTFKNLKNILATSVEALPDNSNIAVMSFASGTTTAMEFNQDTELATTAIRNLIASSSGSSCMNDGLYDAINKLSGAPGRKAVILITASADDCARRTPQEVGNLAQSNRVQIYPVGLQGYTITQNDLDTLAQPTGGLAEVRDEGGISFGVSNVIGLLRNQWTAKATVYPSSGDVAATLTVNLSDNISITSPQFTFVSSQDYIPPTEIILKGNVQSVAEGILFNMDIRQRDKIRQLNVTIVSNETGQSVVAQSLISFSEVNTVPTVSLIPGSEYTLNVSALDAGGNILSEDSAEFTYEPPAANLRITDVETPSPDLDYFLVNVATQNISGVVKYKAWFGEGETRAVIEGSEVTVPLGDSVLIPGDVVRSGTYLVFIQALDEHDTVLAEAPPFELVYKRLSIFQTFPRLVSSSPLAITAITGVCCFSLIGILAIVWLVLPKRSAKSAEVDLILPQKDRRQAPPAPRPAPQQRPPGKEGEPTPDDVVIPIPPRAPAKVVDDKPVTPKPQVTPEEGSGAMSDLPSARIELLQPDNVEFSIEMRHTPFSIGRRKGNDAILPVDNSSGVSGNHLILTYENGEYYILDEKSTYGTTIDGDPVTKGTSTALKNGAVIGLGPNVKIVFWVLKT